MGAYGSPELPPIRKPDAFLPETRDRRSWGSWTGHEAHGRRERRIRRPLGFWAILGRVMALAIAIPIITVAIMLVVAVVQVAMGAHPAP